MKTQLPIKWLLPFLLMTTWLCVNSCKDKESEGKIVITQLAVSDCSPLLKSDSPYPEEEFRFEKINDFSYRFVHKNLLLNCAIEACQVKVLEDTDGFVIYEYPVKGELEVDCLCLRDVSCVLNSTKKLSGCTVTVYYDTILCYTGIVQ